MLLGPGYVQRLVLCVASGGWESAFLTSYLVRPLLVGPGLDKEARLEPELLDYNCY